MQRRHFLLMSAVIQDGCVFKVLIRFKRFLGAVIRSNKVGMSALCICIATYLHKDTAETILHI